MKYLLPDDVDNFSNSCEEFHAISINVLPRHEELKKRYSQVSLYYNEDHPLFLLRDILQDSEIAWYVKTMSVEARDVYYLSKSEKFRDKAREIAVECKDDIVRIVQACPHLDDKECERWIEMTLLGNYNTAVALLAYMCPCIEDICLTDKDPNSELNYLALEIGYAYYLDPNGSHAFSKLVRFEERGRKVEDTRSIQSFGALSGLPSMRRYIGRYLYHEVEWSPPTQKSAITGIELYKCMIHVAVLRSAFGGIANLRDFTYEYYWACEGPGSESRLNGWERDWRPGEIVLSLLEFAGHSLVHLDRTRNGSRETQRVEEVRGQMERGLEEKQEEDDGEDENDEDKDDGDEDDEDEVIGIVKLFIGSLRGF